MIQEHVIRPDSHMMSYMIHVLIPGCISGED